ncbi:unnamed protein product, partial [Oppiella nova]
MIWYETHNKEPGLLWSDNVEEIVSYVLLISVVIISQLLAFTIKSRIEYVPYFPASKTSNEFSFKRKRTGSSGSYTRNMNGNNCTSGAEGDSDWQTTSPLATSWFHNHMDRHSLFNAI